MTNVYVFWGGEICQHATPPTLYYTVDVQAVIPFDLHSGFNVFQHMIKGAMRVNSDESITVIGRVILNTPMGMTHSAFQITNEEEWQYFIQQTLPLGDLHVYIIPQTYVAPQIRNDAAFYDTYGHFHEHDRPYVEDAVAAPHHTTSTSVASSSHQMDDNSSSSDSSETEPILSASSESSDEEDIDESIPYDFNNMEETAEALASRGQTMPDSNIPFYRSGVSPQTTRFSHGFTEMDDDVMPSYDPSTNVIQVGMVFPGFHELKKAVTIYSMRNKRTFVTKHKKKTNWRIVCPHYHSAQQSCLWTLSAKKLHGATSEWMVTKFFEPHVCTPNYNEGGADRMCTSTLICDLIFHKINVDPQYKIKHIQVDVKQHYGVDITYKKAWYARQKCIEMQYGNFQQSYNDLPIFLRKLQLSNPGTIVHVQCTPSDKGEAYRHFKYAFWAFKPAIDGFRHCMPVIAVDGTHLYNKYKGHLILAVGMTANKEIYPLAYSIVDSENNASWTWFLRHLARDVFPDYASMCIISDRHAGIDAAFNSVAELQAPRVKRRYCLRHIRSNVMTKVGKNRRLRSLIWEAGTAVTRSKFLEHMQTIQQNWPNAYTYLARLDEEAWTLSHDDGHRYGIMTTNSSESFNNSLKGCRMLPVTAIARMTFYKLRTMFADRRTAGEVMLQRGLSFTPKISEDLSFRDNESAGASIERYNDRLGLYGVALNTAYMLQGLQNHVQLNLTTRTCNCGMWNVNGIPCAHVIAACNFRREGYYSFVPEVYSVQNYMSCYAGNFYPVDEESQWTNNVTCLPPNPAGMTRSHRGQRQTRRFRNEMDFSSNTNQRCIYCRASTHTSMQCPRLNHQ